MDSTIYKGILAYRISYVVRLVGFKRHDPWHG